MRTLLTFLLVLSIKSMAGQQTITISDFQHLDNTSWAGHLMYINYGDGKEVRLRTTMQISIRGNRLIRAIQYPDEPSANGKNSISIQKNDTSFGKEKIVQKTIAENGDMKLITRFEGQDNDKPATLTMTYHITETTLSITKEVRYQDSKETLVRNKYSYSKL